MFFKELGWEGRIGSVEELWWILIWVILVFGSGLRDVEVLKKIWIWIVVVIGYGFRVV